MKYVYLLFLFLDISYHLKKLSFMKIAKLLFSIFKNYTKICSFAILLYNKIYN